MVSQQSSTVFPVPLSPMLPVLSKSDEREKINRRNCGVIIEIAMFTFATVLLLLLVSQVYWKHPLSQTQSYNEPCDINMNMDVGVDVSMSSHNLTEEKKHDYDVTGMKLKVFLPVVDNPDSRYRPYVSETNNTNIDIKKDDIDNKDTGGDINDDGDGGGDVDDNDIG